MIVRDAVAVYPVVPFLGLRFTLAALLLLPVLRTGRSGIRAGIVPGVLLASGYLTQTVGLEYTTASQAGIFTGLYVILTPVLEFAIFRVRPRAETGVAVAAVTVGSVLLAGGGQSSGQAQLTGDLLEIATAFLFALHIVLLGRLAPGRNAGVMALAQMAVASVLFLGASARQGFPPVSGEVLFAVAVTGALASAVAFWVQTLVQQRIAPARTALIMVAEPAFAAFIGILLAGDTFSAAQLAGAIIILVVLAGHEALSYRSASSAPALPDVDSPGASPPVSP